MARPKKLEHLTSTACDAEAAAYLDIYFHQGNPEEHHLALEPVLPMSG
jgi:hypothetical protein